MRAHDRRRCPGLVAAALVLACNTSPATADDGTTTLEDPSTGAPTTTGSSFVVSPDAVAPECDPGRQDCPAGQKCTPFASAPGCCVDSTRCVPLSGERAEGDACTREGNTDDCGLGLFCLTSTSGGSGDGTCLALCDFADPAACDPGACVQFNDGVLPLCRPPCDPLQPTCPEGQACYGVLTDQAFVCLASTYADGGGGPGDSCETVSGCQPGLLCAPQSELADCTTDLCCTRVCPLGATDCPAPLSCEQAYDPDKFPAYADVGYCRVPED